MVRKKNYEIGRTTAAGIQICIVPIMRITLYTYRRCTRNTILKYLYIVHPTTSYDIYYYTYDPRIIIIIIIIINIILLLYPPTWFSCKQINHNSFRPGT